MVFPALPVQKSALVPGSGFISIQIFEYILNKQFVDFYGAELMHIFPTGAAAVQLPLAVFFF